jgi:hypothetical protein
MSSRPTLFDYATRSMAVQQTDGTPDTTGLPTDLITIDGQPYLERFFLLGSARSQGSARYHHILSSDPQDMHDHPWDFITTILSGSYVETTTDSECEYGPGSVLVRRAEHLHRLTISSPVWTMVVTSPARRSWGYQVGARWVPWQSYRRI